MQKKCLVIFLIFLILSFASCSTSSYIGSDTQQSQGLSEVNETAPDSSMYTFSELTKKRFTSISLTDFSDGFNHARYQYENSIPPYELYDESQILGIAENIIYTQNPDGGWDKNVDLQRIYTKAELEKIQSENSKIPAVTYYLKTDKHGSTMDNRNIHSQIKYLCQVYEQVKDKKEINSQRYLDSATKALQWIFNAQHPVSGGWTGADVYGITFNDDVMSDCLVLLGDIAEGKKCFNVFPSQVRNQAKLSWDRGIDCIMKTQITVTLNDGTKLLTAWGQQYYHDTFQPRWAREFEPPSICSSESFKVLKFLMSVNNPTQDIKNAVKAGVDFFNREDVRIHGKKVYDRPLDTPVYWESVNRVDTKERIMEDCVDCGHTNDIWARFYALDKSFDLVKDARHTIQGEYPEVLSPVWCDRKCKYVKDYMDISQERRSGYGYTTKAFYSVLNEYNVWSKKYPD